jgi:ribonuclease P protein component
MSTSNGIIGRSGTVWRYPQDTRDFFIYEVRVQRKFRLTRTEDFKRVRRSGKSYAHPLVVLVVQANNETRSNVRVGVAAGRTVGNAVKRNRAKRLLRAAMQTLLPSLASGCDLVLIARPALVSSTLNETRQALLSLLHRSKLISLPDAAWILSAAWLPWWAALAGFAAHAAELGTYTAAGIGASVSNDPLARPARGNLSFLSVLLTLWVSGNL